MALLSVQDVPVIGEEAIVFVAADVAGDTVPTPAGAVLLVRNDSVAAITVTATTPGTVEGLAIQDPVISVPAGGVGAFPLVSRVLGATAVFDYSDVTTVTVAAIKPAR